MSTCANTLLSKLMMISLRLDIIAAENAKNNLVFERAQLPPVIPFSCRVVLD